MEAFEVYKFLHIAAAIVWVGGGAVATVFAARLGAATPEHRLGFARDMEFASTRVFMPASLLTLLFGILMVVDSDVFAWEQAWVVIGLSAVVISAVLGMAYLGPQSAKLVAELEAGDPAAAERIRGISLVSRLDLVVLFVAVWAMVVKPGL